MAMRYDGETLRAGAATSAAAAQEASAAQVALSGAPVGARIFGTVDAASSFSAMVDSVRAQQAKAMSVVADNADTAALRATRTADLGNSLALITAQVAGGATYPGQQ